MSCEICKKGACTRSFHSLEVQEDFDEKRGDEEDLELLESKADARECDLVDQAMQEVE